MPDPVVGCRSRNDSKGRLVVCRNRRSEMEKAVRPCTWKVLLICLLPVIGTLGGCVRSSVRPFLPRGSILLLPPRDVIQDGKFHERGVNSGATLLQGLRSDLDSQNWTTILTDNRNFSHLAIATERDALAEAKRLSARYVLQVVLGEFRDAAPMTFRKDFVTLQSARLWDAESGQLIWALSAPAIYEKTNFGGIDSLLDNISEFIVDSISQ